MEYEDHQSYNQRLEKIRDKNKYPYDDFVMTENGRRDGEYSFIYIENKCFKGYGFYDLYHQINSKEKILNRLVSMDNNSDCQALIITHIKKNKYRKLIPLKDIEVKYN